MKDCHILQLELWNETVTARSVFSRLFILVTCPALARAGIESHFAYNYDAYKTFCEAN